ncbi:MAG TPA: AAA family ATPase [Anaerolineales bacterium]|nr:AAA family ATPase [Anaerolineales bacterium]
MAKNLRTGCDPARNGRADQVNVWGLNTTFPPLKTLDSFPNNLPVQITSFVGRKKEICEIKRALNHHLLVTLIGTGGTGKTRLSLQVAADLLDYVEHGIWFVELAPLTDPELIPQTILSAIGIQDQAGNSPLEFLKSYLRDKYTLIIFDNCEHLIAACAKTAEALLNAAPNLNILASSREALGVKGGKTYHVPSLSLPDPKQTSDLEQIDDHRQPVEQVSVDRDRAVIQSQSAPARLTWLVQAAGKCRLHKQLLWHSIVTLFEPPLSPHV